MLRADVGHASKNQAMHHAFWYAFGLRCALPVAFQRVVAHSQPHVYACQNARVALPKADFRLWLGEKRLSARANRDLKIYLKRESQ